MKRPSRTSIVQGALLIFAMLLIGQAVRIQLVQGEMWAERARRQQFQVGRVVAPRGKILDASGNVLAESRELFRINIAPQEVKDDAALRKELRNAGFNREAIRLATNRAKKWVTLPGLYVPTEIASLTAVAGVHPETVVKREYVSAPGIRRVVGALDGAGRAVAGIELALDSILAGDSTQATVARDVRGRRLDSPDTWLDAPRSGSNVTLTINRDLQEICERALGQAADSLEATGGDIVVLNPVTGEVLALAALRRGQPSFSATAVTEPFEPGSTLKPFVAAALLERRRATSGEMMSTFGGQMRIGSRLITDLHRAKELSLADVIRFSSNIGIVRFGSRLTRRETFETLRDLGFGAPTGVPIPGEAGGTLREPAKWQSTSPASLAMGYEIAVTPLQLVTAYAALANGGEVMQPHIVREIRTPDGELLYRARPRVLRRVFRDEVAREVRSLLVNVVNSGTAMQADLATWRLAGKSGTARRTEGGQYVEGNYTASFVGLFPADKPQYVVLVKLDSPRRAYYGGEVAAPVSAVVLRAALAARDAALDRGGLAEVDRNLPALTPDSAPKENPGSEIAAASREEEPEPILDDAERVPQPAKTFALPLAKKEDLLRPGLQPVPETEHLTTRNAVRALHKAGFRVTLSTSQSAPTIPAAGSMLPPGSTVKLRHID